MADSIYAPPRANSRFRTNIYESALVDIRSTRKPKVDPLAKLIAGRQRREARANLKLGTIMEEATSSPDGIRKDELFRILTGESVSGASARDKASAKQFALDNLGPDTRTKQLGDPYKYKEVLNLFSQFNPGDPYFKALYAGLRGK